MNKILRKIVKIRTLKASALFYALFISVIVGLLCTALITAAYFNRVLFEKDRLNERLIRNAQSGLSLLQTSAIVANDSLLIDLYGTENDSVFLQYNHWGLFGLARSIAFHQNRKVTISCLTGYLPNEQLNSALYLQNHANPLSLCGNTVIKGNAYLPDAGVQSGYINRKSFIGSRYIHGQSRRSETSLPEIKEQWLKDLTNLAHQNQSDFHTIPDSLDNSFFEPALTYRQKNIRLSNQQLKGHIYLIADSLITVSSNAVLEHVILIAPVIKVEKGFSGKVQLFSTQTLHLEQDVQLIYPSTAALLINQSNGINSPFRVGKNSIINGMALLYEMTNQPYHPTFELADSSLVNGQLYTNSYVELKGKVEGNLTCRGFIYRTPATIYENFLVDATIDVSKRHSPYMVPGIFKLNDSKSIIAWLD